MSSAEDVGSVDAITTVTGPEYSFKMDGVQLEEDSLGVLTLQPFKEITLDLLEFGRVSGELYITLIPLHDFNPMECNFCLEHGGAGFSVTCLNRGFDVSYQMVNCEEDVEFRFGSRAFSTGVKIIGNDLTSLPLMFWRSGPRIKDNLFLLEVRTPFVEFGQGVCIYVECRFA